jgi:iron complex outermembrane receptor protein
MNSGTIDRRRRWRREALLVVACGLSLADVQAQEDAPEAAPTDTVEEITVTGSRISRDEFSSPSPIQVLDAESGRQLGISSITEMLQRATVANGTQIDATLNTNAGNSNATEAPPTGGVGSSNIDLRGLGPERTLVLVNGRRLGSVGVRGAPAQPDINLIPFSLVDHIEVLTEGVSAVYGADAVAGVVNVILREDFEGVEVTLNSELPGDPGGEVKQASLIAGAQGERASIIFGAEVYDRQRVRVGDRDFSHCLRDINVTPSGEILSNCNDGFFDNVVLAPGISGPGNDIWALYTPGQTNIGVPNFSDWTALPDPQALNPANGDWSGSMGNEINNRQFHDFYGDQDERRMSDLVGELERLALMMTGRVDMDWWANEEIFFETYYLNSRTLSIATAEQIFPDIPAFIPQEDVNGNPVVYTTDQLWETDQVDPDTGTCDPNAADGFEPGQNIPAGAFPCAGALRFAAGTPILVPNPLNPFGVDAVPILTLEDLPQTRDVERELMRFVGGLRGDFGDSTWRYEAFASYDRGIGFQAQPILFEPHLRLATLTTRLDADGNVICGVRNPTGGLGGFDTPSECVPLDAFGLNSNGAVFTGGATGEGVLTDAERDYLIGNRTNRTVVEQMLWGAFATGDLFTIGDRTIAAAIGAEYRTDTISSQNDITGVHGHNAAENPLQEGETHGERSIVEAYGELNIPLLETLAMDAAVRYTDEENFGEEVTWRARLAWSPLDWVTLSGSAGTSYRAPNLREQFLADQGGGIGGNADPCLPTNLGTMDPGDRAQTIARCIESGVEFTDEDGDGEPETTVLGSQGVTTIPISTGGNDGLLAETSDSYTATIQFSQPWSNAFDLDLALSWWSIDIENTVEEPDAQFIIDQCFTNFQLPGFNDNDFCRLIGRPNIPGGNPASNIINFVDVSFINIGEDTAAGLDLNTRLLFSIDRLGLDVAWATATTRQLEREQQPFGPDTRMDLLGTIGVPELKFTSTLSLRRSEWELLMQNRFLGRGQQPDTDPDAIDLNHRAGVEGVLSHDVDFVDSTWYTDVSVNYVLDDSWSFTVGVNNLFDQDPPLIDAGEGPNENNAVSSAGYDFFGRTVFATVSASF